MIRVQGTLRRYRLILQRTTLADTRPMYNSERKQSARLAHDIMNYDYCILFSVQATLCDGVLRSVCWRPVGYRSRRAIQYTC